MAFQDSWARPLADELVSLFRVDSISYVRRGVPVYDPATGQTNHAEQVFQSWCTYQVLQGRGRRHRRHLTLEFGCMRAI